MQDVSAHRVGYIDSYADGVGLTDRESWPPVITRSIKENARRLPDTFKTDSTIAKRLDLLLVSFYDELNA